MTTTVINNVPRELLERASNLAFQTQHYPLHEELRALLSAPSPANHVEDVRAMVADPSPAGVDGLEVETFLHTLHMELGQTEQFCSKWKGDPFGVSGVDYSSTYSVTSEPLCRLSDAQAIIDGLRGEVERLGSQKAEWVERATALGQKEDQQAQRIGELEGLLRAESARVDFLDAYIVTADAPDTGKAAMLADSGTLRECIDAALSDMQPHAHSGS